MWVFLNNAALSIVRHRDQEGMLLVRARVEGHIEAVFPDAETWEDLNADYRYRAVIEELDVGQALSMAALSIDYGNFKNSVEDDELKRAYSATWSILSRLQPTAPWSGRGQWEPDLFDQVEIRSIADPVPYYVPGPVWCDHCGGLGCLDDECSEVCPSCGGTGRVY